MHCETLLRSSPIILPILPSHQILLPLHFSHNEVETRNRGIKEKSRAGDNDRKSHTVAVHFSPL